MREVRHLSQQEKIVDMGTESTVRAGSVSLDIGSELGWKRL